MAARPGSKLSGSGLAWAVTYGVISVVITLFNKAVLTSYGFSAAMTLTLLQGLVSVVGCELLKATGKPELQYPAFNLKTVWQVAPLSFVFIAYVVISLMALERVNIPMFTALRRLTICFVMVEEYFLLDKTSSVDITRSVYVMMLGAAIAAWKDLTFDPVSYFYLL
jgi:solute carrier family 35 protein